MLSIFDYILQGIMAVLVLVYPWFLKPGQGRRAFWIAFLAVLAWGLWRVAYFDPATHNDVPGIGYIISALVYGFLARLFFAIRCAILRRRATQ